MVCEAAGTRGEDEEVGGEIKPGLEGYQRSGTRFCVELEEKQIPRFAPDDNAVFRRVVASG